MSSQVLKASAQNIKLVSKLLKSGELIGIPTETVYGLAADGENAQAVAKIFQAKGRPLHNPLIAHVSSLEKAQQYGVFNELAQKLARAFWPGALTLVVNKRADAKIAEAVTSGGPTVALRCPNHPVAREILSQFGGIVVAPSANRSNHVSPTLAQHVVDDLGDKVKRVIDGGSCSSGLESTVIAAYNRQPVLLRAGSVTCEQINDFLLPSGYEPLVMAPTPPVISGEVSVMSPGMLPKHYAPNIPLEICAGPLSEQDGLLTFSGKVWRGQIHCRKIMDLSPIGNFKEAAQNLYVYLRELEQSGVKRIVTWWLPNEDLGVAINDRLRRAACSIETEGGGT